MLSRLLNGSTWVTQREFGRHVEHVRSEFSGLRDKLDELHDDLVALREVRATDAGERRGRHAERQATEAVDAAARAGRRAWAGLAVGAMGAALGVATAVLDRLA